MCAACFLQCRDIGPVVDLVGRNGVPKSMAGKQDKFRIGVLEAPLAQGAGWFAVRGFHLVLGQGNKEVGIVQAAAADDANTRVHVSP